MSWHRQYPYFGIFRSYFYFSFDNTNKNINFAPNTYTKITISNRGFISLSIGQSFKAGIEKKTKPPSSKFGRYYEFKKIKPSKF